jgi:hypothetical protein
MALAPSKPSKFKRSSERKVGELSLRQWAFADAREEDRRLEAFESIGMSAASAAGLVTPVQLEERRYSCPTEDESSFDEDGWVR